MQKAQLLLSPPMTKKQQKAFLKILPIDNYMLNQPDVKIVSLSSGDKQTKLFSVVKHTV